MSLCELKPSEPDLWANGNALCGGPLKTKIPEEVLAGTPPEVLAMLFPGLEKLPTVGIPQIEVEPAAPALEVSLGLGAQSAQY